MIADMLRPVLLLIYLVQLDSVVTELFIRGRKLSITLVFVTKSYFAEPKSIRLNFTQFLLISNKLKFQ